MVDSVSYMVILFLLNVLGYIVTQRKNGLMGEIMHYLKLILIWKKMFEMHKGI